MGESFVRLKKEWLFLRGVWQATREHWQDEVAERFEQQFWNRWDREVPGTLVGMQELEEVLRQIKNERGYGS
ncbi:MAG: hypothetical protein SCK29_12930 [Bacillota bacterium]|nr:hypothetical protein [Bacillota bacterium]MDW7685004.1 hypothetical protein [Bacillota bacterium]